MVNTPKNFLHALTFGRGTPEGTNQGLAPSDAYCDRLLQVYEYLLVRDALVCALPDWVSYGHFSLTTAGLREMPRLQAALANCTAYTPGKWLLEQELSRRLIEPGDASNKKTTWPVDQQLANQDVFDAAHEANLQGLAFSGGGIRSATFCLGALQAFAACNQLERFDYLSSVSGGGYIHQWFASWVYNQPPKQAGSAEPQPAPKLAAVQDLLKPLPAAEAPARQPSQIQWLRRYASYLTPQRGIFSVDTWTMLCIWFRNTFLNQIVLFGFLGSCVLAARILLLPLLYAEGGNRSWFGMPAITFFSLLFINLYQLTATCLLGRALYSLKAAAQPTKLPGGALTNAQVLWFIVVPGFLAAYAIAFKALFYPYAGFHLYFSILLCWTVQIFLLLISLVLGGLLPPAEGSWQVHRAWIALLGCFTAAAIALGVGLTAWSLTTVAPRLAPDAQRSRLFAASTTLSQEVNVWLAPAPHASKLPQSASGSAPAKASHHELTSSAKQVAPPMKVHPETLFGLFAPLLFLALQFVALRLQIGVLGSAWAECRREWMARFGAWSALASGTWLVIGAITWLGPTLCGWFLDSSNWHKLSTVFGVVALHAGTLYAGSSGKTDGKPKPGSLFGYSALDLVSIIGAPFCILTILVMIAGIMELVVSGQIRIVQMIPNTVQFTVADATHLIFLRLGLLGVLLTATFLFFGWRVDVNEFSMHGYYRNRLARCYLGATNMMRSPDPFTGFDDHTETRSRSGMAVSSLLPARFGGTSGFDGPFPIFCSTLNLTFGGDLAYQERKGASFAFSPLYSGYHVGWTAETRHSGVDTTFNGYVPTELFAYRNGGVSLCSAAAVSGAALSPNQGYSSQPALAFLMTLFNVRLGYWIANPRKNKIWPNVRNKPTPAFGLRYLLAELFGLSNDTSNFVALCDGGKFDNMGLYELIRRRCRFIVLCDAEADADYNFEGMGGAIAKARTDFGAEITIDLHPLRPDPETGMSGAHFVRGTIHYPKPPIPAFEPDGKQREYCGEIVYIKSAVTGTETGDILHHKLTHAAFPNDNTVNQWFTESQFESYRRLGEIAATEACASLNAMAAQPPLPASAPQIDWSEIIAWVKRNE